MTTHEEQRGGDFNRQWFDYTGFSLHESYGIGWQAAVHPDELNAVAGRWEAIIRCSEPGEMVMRLRRFDGAYRRFLMRVSPLTNATGQVAKLCGVGTDIEGTRPADHVQGPGSRRSAAEREDRFRAILDGLPALVTLMRPVGELEFANRQTLEYFGATLDEATRWTPASTFHPDDRPEALAAWVRSVERGVPYDFKGRQRRVDGIYRWFHLQGFPLRDANGAIVLWYLLQTDIDNRKRVEALLSGEKRLLEMVARGRPLAVGFDALCELVEGTNGPCHCSILLVDPTATTFRNGVAPSLPPSFNAAFDGTKVDPAEGAYGMALTIKMQVIVATWLRIRVGRRRPGPA